MRRLGRPPVVTNAFLDRLKDRAWNEEHFDLSLKRRAVLLNDLEPLYNNDRQHRIGGRHLGNLLRQAGYRYVVPKKRMYNERPLDEQLSAQQEFVCRLESYKMHGLPIIYFDECTANTWST